MNKKPLRLTIYLLAVASLCASLAYADELTPDSIKGRWQGSDGNTYKISVQGTNVTVDEVAGTGMLTGFEKTRQFLGPFSPDGSHLAFTPKSIDDFASGWAVEVKRQLLDRHITFKSVLSRGEGETLSFVVWSPAVISDPQTLKVKRVLEEYGDGDLVTLSKGVLQSRISRLRVVDRVRALKALPLREQIANFKKEKIAPAQADLEKKMTEFQQATRRVDEIFAQKIASEKELASYKEFLKTPRYPDSTRVIQAKLKEVETLYFEQQQKFAAASDDVEGPANALQAAESVIIELDYQLSDMKHRLSQMRLTPSIPEVSVAKGGKTVYQGHWDVTPVDLYYSKIEGQIAEARIERDNLVAEKERSFNAFQKAVDRAMALQKKLSGDQRARGQGTIAELRGLADGGVILDTAWENFAVDALFHAYDLAKAGSKGGIYGMLHESASKLAQKYVFQGLGEGKAYGEAVDPVSIEAEVNASYGAGIKDPKSLSCIMTTANKLGMERSLKSTLFSSVKGAVDRNFGKVDAELMVRTAIEKGYSAKHIKSLNDYVANLGKQTNLLDAAKLAEGVLKDCLKEAIKVKINKEEHDAWVDFFAKDIQARALYPIYQIANASFLKADEKYQDLVQAYSKIHKAPPHPKYKALVSEFFENDGELIVTVAVTEDAKSVKEHVELDRLPCEFISPHQFKGTVRLDNVSGDLELVVEQFDEPDKRWDSKTYEGIQKK